MWKRGIEGFRFSQEETLGILLERETERDEIAVEFFRELTDVCGAGSCPTRLAALYIYPVVLYILKHHTKAYQFELHDL